MKSLLTTISNFDQTCEQYSTDMKLPHGFENRLGVKLPSPEPTLRLLNIHLLRLDPSFLCYPRENRHVSSEAPTRLDNIAHLGFGTGKFDGRGISVGYSVAIGSENRLSAYRYFTDESSRPVGRWRRTPPPSGIPTSRKLASSCCHFDTPCGRFGRLCRTQCLDSVPSPA